MKLSLVIPAYNEAESLPILADEIAAVCSGAGIDYEAFIIDDGSTDNTFACAEDIAARNARFHGVRLRRNCGKAAALSEGFRRARGEFIVTLDADLQDNPAEIPAMLALLDQGFDLVSGWKRKRLDPLEKRLPSKLFNAVISRVSGLKLHDFNCGFKAYRREVVENIDLYGELHRYIPVLAHWSGFKVVEKTVDHRSRQHGRSKYGLARYTNGFFDMITLVFLHRYTSRPLHLFGLVGLLFTVVGLAVMAGFGIDWAISGNIHVRPLMLAGVASMIVGIQFVSIGLLGEMITNRLAPASPPPIRCATKGCPGVNALQGKGGV